MKIYVSGSLAYDRIMDFPGNFADHILPGKLHILNVCFMVNGLTEKFGGTAGNIAYSLALLGEKPVILAAAGEDFGRYRKRLEDLGLPLSGVISAPGVLTAGAYITTDKADNQITAFNPGAMDYPSNHSFDGDSPEETLAIISPGNLEDMKTYAAEYRERGIRYIFDPGQSIPAFSGRELTEMMTGSELMICNDYELEMVRQAAGLSTADIMTRTRSLITTLGEAGSRVTTPDGEAAVPAAPVSEIKDPTGAGDAYRAGLIKGLVDGRDLAEAARLGAVCAAYAVEHYGTQEHHFTPDEFRARYTENFG